MAQTPENDADIQNIVAQIDLYESWLQSIKETDDSDDVGLQAIYIEENLQELRQELRRLQPQRFWGDAAADHEQGGSLEQTQTPSSNGSYHSSQIRPNSSHSSTGPALVSHETSNFMSAPDGGFSNYSNHELPYLTLPNRSGGKRPLSNHDDFESFQRGGKSRKTTPSPAITAPSTPASNADSFDYDFGDDPMLEQLLGENLKEELRSSRQYAKELEMKQEQEKRDEEYARSLQEQWNPLPMATSKPVSSMSNQYQTKFDPLNGAYRKMPPPPRPIVKTEQPVKSEFGHSRPATFAGPSSSFRQPYTGIDSPVSLSSDSSDLEEITAADFTPSSRTVSYRPSSALSTSLYPTTQSQGDDAAGAYTMPGAFPESLGMGGTSVYNAPGYAPYNPYAQPGMINNTGRPILNGHDNVVGPGARPMPTFDDSDMDDFLWDRRDPSAYADPAKTEAEIKDLLKHIRPDEELDTADRERTPPQMKFQLMPHQQLGLAWMKQMEEGTNKGGILADDMGLGKTIQALSLIISRPSSDPRCKTTLIVAPVALMQQWKREISKAVHTRHQLSVLILHGDKNRNLPWSRIREHDVVLTTYGLLASELKRKHKWDQRRYQFPDIQPQGKEDYLPILGDTSKWYRAILDESQAIKNKNTKAAIGASFINCEYRWCMSGTPMQNNVEELQSLIHFLRIRPYNDHRQFTHNFTTPLRKGSELSKTKALTQLQALLKAILLRRTKTSLVDGKPIIRLPPKTVEERRAVFSPDEKEFYKALESKIQLQFNKYLKAGTIGRHYSNMLVLLLRLRQACCHPHLIKDFAINTGGPAGTDAIENARTLPDDVIERLRQMEGFECPICCDAAENPVIFNPCGHFVCSECLSRWTEQNLQNGEPDVKCPHCRAKIDLNKVTDHDSFRRVHCQGEEGVEPPEDINNNDDRASDSDSESSDDEEDDDDDGEDLNDFIVPDEDPIEYDASSEDDTENYRPGKSPFEKSKKGKMKAEGEDDGDDEPKSSLSKRVEEGKEKKQKCKSKGKQKRPKKEHKSLAQLRKEGLRNKTSKKKYLRKLEKDWVTSAKIEKTMELLRNTRGRGEGEKTIVFSSFTSFLDLLEVPISRAWGIGAYMRYDGSMSANDRNDAVYTFTDRPDCQILLVSIKAGNAGLNLTAASQVIILDPYWNPYVEAQAVDRAYRIGQVRPVEVHRVLISNEGMDPDEDGNATVEDRILALQEKKRALVESALDENAGRAVARLGVRELGFLFVSNMMIFDWRMCTNSWTGRQFYVKKVKKIHMHDCYP